MKFNTRIRYGIRAMIEIALEESDSGVFQKDISERQKISLKYLDFIITSLKAAGLIRNARGRKSGYKIARPLHEIKIMDIYRAFEPEIEVVDCMNRDYLCDLAPLCSSKDFWSGLNETISRYFETHTLEELVAEHRKKAAAISN